MHSVHAQWGTSTRPVDILVVSGVNNLSSGESVELIMERYARFREMAENIGLGDPTGKSTLACGRGESHHHEGPQWPHAPSQGARLQLAERDGATQNAVS